MRERDSRKREGERDRKKEKEEREDESKTKHDSQFEINDSLDDSSDLEVKLIIIGSLCLYHEVILNK